MFARRYDKIDPETLHFESKLLRSFVAAHEWPAWRIAERAGYTRQELSHWCCGKHRVRLMVFVDLLEAMGLEMVVRDKSTGEQQWPKEN